MTTKPDTLDDFIKATIEELRDCGYDDDEIAQMIIKTAVDVLSASNINDF